MKKYFSMQLPERIIKICSWVVVVIILLISFKNHPLSAVLTGDEPYYLSEVNYLSHYGFYQALSQGTSLGYSGVSFLLAKIIPVEIGVLMKLLSAVCCVFCCIVLLKILDLYHGLRNTTKYLALVFFAYTSNTYAFRALPDIANTLILFTAILVLLRRVTNERMGIVGLLIFFGFTFKPVAIFYIPGVLLFLFLNKGVKMKAKMMHAFIFLAVFSGCFLVYQLPSYKLYGRLMLEDKNHYYESEKRVETTTNWPEINTYYLVFNPDKNQNEWHVNVDDVAAFKKNNPGKLDLSYGQFVKQHPDVWRNIILSRALLDLPYSIDCGMFYHKWTYVNRWIKNMAIIKMLSLVILLFFCGMERKLILNNPAFLIPLLYYLLLTWFILIPPQNNWLIPCIAFFALPVYEGLQKKIPAILLLTAQLILAFL